MASYTDQIPKFNPYVQELPIQAMVEVGMEKQRRYDEGLQRIQQNFNNVAGLQVLRPQDKDYLQSQLNQLGSKLKTFAASDFSNYQLVNSVNGMTGQIIKDPFIQAAVKSAAHDQNEMSRIQKDEDDGKLNPANSVNYLKKRQAYLDAGLKDANGKPVTLNASYVPAFDYFKFAKETFDAVKPDGLTWDQVYETDGNGNPKIDRATGKPIYSPVMIRMEKEGRFPEKVRQTLDQIFADPRVGRQLQIEGEYTYGGLDSKGLIDKSTSQMNSVVESLNDQLAELQIKKNAGQDVQAQIDNTIDNIQKVKENFGEYAKLAVDNPEGARGALFQNDVRSRYTTMFGEIKQKTTNMENPGWNANFKLLQEANEQSRFAQTLAFQKQAHREKMNMDVLKMQQDERLAKLKGTRLGSSIGGSGFGDTNLELADVSSDAAQIILMQENAYTQAADNFSNKSNAFLWDNVFSKMPANKAKYDALYAKNGGDKNAAINTLMNNIANSAKDGPLGFKTRWSKLAEENYNKNPNNLSHSVKDSYNEFVKARTEFQLQSGTQAKINEDLAQEYGKETTKEATTAGYKDQKITYNGKQINITKDDAYDIAIYLRGNKESLGMFNDGGAKKAAEQAAARLEARGKGELIDAALRGPGKYTANLMTYGVRRAKEIGGRYADAVGELFSGEGTFGDRLGRQFSKLGNLAKDVIAPPSMIKDASGLVGGPRNYDPGFNQVMKIYDTLDNDKYTGMLKAKADAIKNAYGIPPNLKMQFLTGDAETDKSLVYGVKRMAGAYTTGQMQNLSPDFKNFLSSIEGKDLTDLNLETTVKMDSNRNPVVEIVSYGPGGKRAGGMTIQYDEAINLGIDVGSMYEPKQISSLRNFMNYNDNQSSAADPSKVSTYMQGDAILNKSDFKNMQGSPYDVKGNFKFQNGLYYGYIYVNDSKTKPAVKETPGVESLTELYNNMTLNTTPAWAQAILNQR
jgi:hypothetical protein